MVISKKDCYLTSHSIYQLFSIAKFYNFKIFLLCIIIYGYLMYYSYYKFLVFIMINNCYYLYLKLK